MMPRRPKITRFICKWQSPHSCVVPICWIPKATLPLSPSAPLPSRGWSSTSGSQMTPPTRPRREGKAWGPCCREGSWEAGGGVGRGAAGLLPQAPVGSEALPREVWCPLLPSGFSWETICFSLSWRWILQTTSLIVKLGWGV